MKTLLLMPKDFYQSWPFPNDFTRFIFHIPAVTYPLLSAMHSDVEFTIFDGLVESISTRSFAQLIKNFDVVCINCPASVVALNIEVNIKLIKRVKPSIKIILGGHHANFYSKEWIKKGADFVVRGEAEITFPRLLNAIMGKEDFSNIPGLTYAAYIQKTEKESCPLSATIEGIDIAYNKDQELIEDLDFSPIPKWGKLNLKNYNLGLNRKGLTATIETSRGCSYRCAFCCVGPMWNDTQRFKSAKRVINEFEALHKMGVRQVIIADDNFGANIERDIEVFERLINLKLSIQWICFLRANIITQYPHFANLAIRAGLKGILVGFESLEVSDLKLFNKNYSQEIIKKYKELYRFLNKNDVFVMGLFLVGFPGQNSSKNLSYKYVNEICDIASFSNFRPTIGISRYDTIANIKGIKLKDMFYHDRYIPTFSLKYKKYKEKTLLGNLKSLLSITKILQLAMQNKTKRVFLSRTYRNILTQFLFSVSLRKIINFIISVNPMMSPDKKQTLINQYYLDEKYISNIVKRNL